MPGRTQEYAPRNFDLTVDERDANAEGVKVIVGLFGGFAGTKAAGIGFAQLSHIMEADPGDDLSGLRMIADRMRYDYLPEAYEDERSIDPGTARRWLLGTSRATETVDGELQILDSDHITLAGLAIASSEGVAGKLTDAYRRITDSPSPLSEDILRDMSWDIYSRYGEPQAH